MNKLLTLISSVVISGLAYSQQDPQFSMAIQNRMSINPGYAGSSGFICGNVIARQQWTGFEGRPRSIAFSADLPILKQTDHPIGLGLTVVSDKAGLQSSTYAKAAFAFRTFIGNEGASLGVGLEFGMINIGYDAGFNAENPNDAKIPFSGISKTAFDLGFGLHFSKPNKYHFGISASHLTASKLTDKNFTYSTARHIYVTGGYDFEMPNNPDIILKPSLLVKSSFQATQIDVNVVALMNNTIWGGLSYRVLGSDAIIPMIGYQKSTSNGRGSVKIGYSYDLTLSKLRNYSTGSHEILLGFCYDITPPIKITGHRNMKLL